MIVLRSSGISRKSAALIVRYSQKKKFEVLLFCSENPSIAHNLGTARPIQVDFQQNVPLQMSTLIK